MVITLVSIMAGLFTNILVSATQIYVDHGQRKTRHIDSRRAMEMISHDIRELNLWVGSPTATVLEFEHTENFEKVVLWWSDIYYDNFKVKYNLSAPRFTYQNEAGTYTNQYNVIEGDIVAGSGFTKTTSGGRDRVKITLQLTVNGKPMRFRTVVFPRKQGG